MGQLRSLEGRTYTPPESGQPKVLDIVRSALREPSPTNIRRAKQLAQEQGIVPGLVAGILLFNAEDFNRH